MRTFTHPSDVADGSVRSAWLAGVPAGAETSIIPHGLRTFRIEVDQRRTSPDRRSAPASGPPSSAPPSRKLPELVPSASADRSLPPGIPPERYGSLVTSLRAAATPVFVDTHGDALVAAAAAHPTALKINAEEAGGLLGRKLATLDDALTAAAGLGSAGISQVVITLGHAGAVLAHAGGVLRAEPPDVDTVSAVGSGDAFLAAFVAAQVEGADPVAALRHAVAAGAANAQTSWGGTFDRARYLALLDRVTVEQP
jgi:hypothetical protein